MTEILKALKPENNFKAFCFDVAGYGLLLDDFLGYLNDKWEFGEVYYGIQIVGKARC